MKNSNRIPKVLTAVFAALVISLFAFLPGTSSFALAQGTGNIAFGAVNADGTLYGGGSGNFVVNKDQNSSGVYYIDSDAFKGGLPAIAATPFSAYNTATAVVTGHWYTGTIRIQTGFTDISEPRDGDFFFMTMQ